MPKILFSSRRSVKDVQVHSVKDVMNLNICWLVGVGDPMIRFCRSRGGATKNYFLVNPPGYPPTFIPVNPTSKGLSEFIPGG